MVHGYKGKTHRVRGIRPRGLADPVLFGGHVEPDSHQFLRATLFSPILPPVIERSVPSVRAGGITSLSHRSKKLLCTAIFLFVKFLYCESL